MISYCSLCKKTNHKFPLHGKRKFEVVVNSLLCMCFIFVGQPSPLPDRTDTGIKADRTPATFVQLNRDPDMQVRGLSGVG